MNINLRIERLILEGLPPSTTAGAHALVKNAVETHLAQLLAAGHPVTPMPLAGRLAAGGAWPGLKARDIALEPDTEPDRLGRQIGGAVHGALTRE